MNREYNIDNEPCCPGGLARACVPMQIMNEVFSPREALKNGTLFPELIKPDFTTGIGDRERGGRYYG
ncbi:spore coat associated protein CotJA [Tissierella pigra]|uniref:spore coat associated protein CotJA n=1 Tax=Tissierella pigra TaxID=2607614 RepID=UPI001C0FA611|nr:spore coat associated protein CotJA [Tissierella pigra]MBU5425749.1 spore coat associated protein CotJA [Tissierella pigra]